MKNNSYYFGKKVKKSIRKTTKGICKRGKVISPPDQMWMEFQLFFSQSAPNINQFLRTSSFANRDEKMFT